MYITMTFKNDLNMLRYAYDVLKELGPQLPPSIGSSFSLSFQPIPPSMTSRSVEKGGNSLGLEDSKGALVLCLIEASWDNPTEDEKIASLGKAVHDRIVTESKKRKLWHQWVYLNYADSWQDPIKGYGDANRKKLRETSKRYDPKGFFQKRVSGNFKLHR